MILSKNVWSSEIRNVLIVLMRYCDVNALYLPIDEVAAARALVSMGSRYSAKDRFMVPELQGWLHG